MTKPLEHDNGGWSEHRREVLNGLSRVEHEIDVLDNKMDQVLGRVNQLEARSTLWGVIGGSIPVLTMFLIYLFLKVGIR